MHDDDGWQTPMFFGVMTCTLLLFLLWSNSAAG